MPPQHESCRHETSSTMSATMVSPSSMQSELNGTLNNVNNRNDQDCQSFSWQKDFLMLDELRDVLAFLKAQEMSYDRRRVRRQQEHRRRTHRLTNGEISNLPPFHDNWRPVMVSWMYHVADTFRLMPIVVATGVYILDTCAFDLCNPSSRTYNQNELYPLMTITALNMAVKCHETKMFPLDQLVKLLGGRDDASGSQSFTPDDVCAMERRLLHRCGWKLHCPTTHDYILRFASVLKEEHKDAVVSFAVMHLKLGLLWEHILHKEKKEEGLFSTCTLAYAAFLLAMEAAGLPITDKKVACMALLEVADLSAKTPQLAEAYNWLCKAKSLQVQLEQGNSPRRAPNTLACSTAVPDHASVKEVQGRPATAFDEMSTDTDRSHPVASSDIAALVEPDSDDEHAVSDDHSTSVMSYGSSVTSDHSVIFYSYSSDGDAVEVVATDISLEEDDDESMDHSATMTVLPTVMEEEDVNADDSKPATLVLSESLDEDGFEVAFEGKRTDRLLGLVSSPRDVSVAI